MQIVLLPSRDRHERDTGLGQVWSVVLPIGAPPSITRHPAGGPSRSTPRPVGYAGCDGGRHPASGACVCSGRISSRAGCLFVTGGGCAGIQAAALVNGTAAHVWDFDDTSYTGIMHGSAVVFPAVLAVAQDRHVDDAALLTAFVAGSEIAYTLADIVGHGHYFQGWWSTGTFGLVGATAGVARLLGLSTGQTAHALAMAAAGAGGGRVVMGTDAKPFLVGETARRAVDLPKQPVPISAGRPWPSRIHAAFLHC